MDAINRGTGLTRRMLITGASGYLGSHLVRRLLALHPGSEIHAVYFTRCPRSLPVPTYSLDLRDRMAVIQFIEEVRPDIIIHTAAQTGSDGLQRNDSHGEAWATNVAGTSHLAESAIRIGARLIHVSTDVVFDGEHWAYPRIDGRRAEVVGRRDGVDVSGEVEVEVLHGDHLAVPAAGGPPLDAEGRALAGLPENQRLAILLCRQDELSYEEIAKVLGCSLSATKSLIHRGRETLKAKLKPYLRTGQWEDKE